MELHFGRLNRKDPTPTNGSSEQTLCIRIYGDMLDAIQYQLEERPTDMYKEAIMDSLYQIFPLTREIRNYFDILVNENNTLSTPAAEETASNVDGTDKNSASSPSTDPVHLKDKQARQIENEKARAEIVSDVLALLYTYSSFELVTRHIEMDGNIIGGLVSIFNTLWEANFS